MFSVILPQEIIYMKTRLLFIASVIFLTLASLQTDAQQLQTMPIASGFNADVIANGIGPAGASINNVADNDGYAFVARDFKSFSNSPALTYGLPNDGVITSAVASPAGLSYQLASYSSNNSLRLPTAFTSGVLTFATPKAAKNLYMLATSGSGNSTVNISVNFTNGTSQTFLSVPVNNWFDGSNFAIQGIGRVQATSGSPLDPAGGINPRLYQIPLSIDAANQSKPIEGITVTKAGGTGITMVFAFSADLYNSCPTPTNAVATSTVSGADISWTAPSNAPAFGYQYYISSSSAYPASTVVPTGSTAAGITTANIAGLTFGQTYYAWIRSNCGGSSQSFWTPATFTVGQISATYTAGDISTLYDSSGVTVTSANSCPGTLSLTVPAGYKIQNTSVSYKMTASNDAWTADQVSLLVCTNNGNKETSVSTGSGNSGGTFSYTRSGLTIANDLTGTVNFELRAWRIFAGTGCNTTYNKIDNNTWKVTVALVPVSLATAETSAKAAEISVYPNPFTGVLNIEKAENTKRATITDMSGITVRTFENPTSKLFLEDLKTGIYILTLNMKDGSKQSIKIIKK
jgi:hypothetical protein